ncbi:MAG: hypothetical protein MRY21_05720 [Simkaniaceae bacterium]|nr:hypothetical protein [Simkaniaceae bacterium]
MIGLLAIQEPHKYKAFKSEKNPVEDYISKLERHIDVYGEDPATLRHIQQIRKTAKLIKRRSARAMEALRSPAVRKKLSEYLAPKEFRTYELLNRTTYRPLATKKALSTKRISTMLVPGIQSKIAGFLEEEEVHKIATVSKELSTGSEEMLEEYFTERGREEIDLMVRDGREDSPQALYNGTNFLPVRYFLLKNFRDSIREFNPEYFAYRLLNRRFYRSNKRKAVMLSFNLLPLEVKNSIYKILLNDLGSLGRLFSYISYGFEREDFLEIAKGLIDNIPDSFSMDVIGFTKPLTPRLKNLFLTLPIRDLISLFRSLRIKVKEQDPVFTLMYDYLIPYRYVDRHGSSSSPEGVLLENFNRRLYKVLVGVCPNLQLPKLFRTLSKELPGKSEDELLAEFFDSFYSVKSYCGDFNLYHCFRDAFQSSLPPDIFSKISREIFGLVTDDTKIVDFFTQNNMWKGVSPLIPLLEPIGHTSLFNGIDLKSLLPTNYEEYCDFVVNYPMSFMGLFELDEIIESSQPELFSDCKYKDLSRILKRLASLG